MLADGLWFSPDTPVSSTTKTGRYDIAETLLKVALNIKNQLINQPYSPFHCILFWYYIRNPFVSGTMSIHDCVVL
jgi:hypothetical protein